MKEAKPERQTKIIKAPLNCRLVIDIPELTAEMIFKAFVDYGFDKYKCAIDKDQTYWKAISWLVGRSDIESVKEANKTHPENKITVEEFRKWLPKMLSEFFEGFL